MADDKKKKEDKDKKPEAAADKAADSGEPKELTEEEKTKKKSFRLFLLLALINVGFLSWLFYTMKYNAKKPKPEPQAEAPLDENTEDDEYIELDAIPIEPFLVNVIARHNGQVRYGKKVMRIAFEVIPESEAAIMMLEKKMPKIRDSVNIMLSNQDYADLATAEGKEELRGYLIETINEAIQPEGITEIYITEFSIN